VEGSGTGLLLESPVMVKARGVFPPKFPMLVAVFGPTMKLMVSEAAIDRVMRMFLCCCHLFLKYNGHSCVSSKSWL